MKSLLKSCGVTFHVVGEDGLTERDERKISQLGRGKGAGLDSSSWGATRSMLAKVFSRLSWVTIEKYFSICS
jgi:hypothetical protein